MIRRLVAGLIVVGLAVGVWALWPREDSDTTPTTLPVAIETTTTTTLATSTTVASTTTSEDDGSHVVTTVEEAETILRELWFGWFEGIYNQDEERIKEVVGTQAFLDAARTAIAQLRFNAEPTLQSIAFEDTEILRSDDACLAVWVVGRAPFVDTSPAETRSVDVARWTGDSWVLVSTWQYREDLWEADCAAALEQLS